MKKYLIISLLILPFVLTTCKQDEEPISKTYGPYYMGEARDYIYFKQGTWWVYENKETKERDSMSVQWVKLDTVTYIDQDYNPSGNVVIKENLEYLVKSHTTGYSYRHYMQAPYVAANMTEEGTGDYFLSRNKSKSGDYVGWFDCFIYPFVKGRITYNSKTLTTDTSLTFNNITFGDVVEVEGKRQLSLYPKFYYYWAPHYGLVQYIERTSDTDPTQWDTMQLVKSHILQ